MAMSATAVGYDRQRHGVHLLSRPEVVAEPAIYTEAVQELGPLFWDEVGRVWVCSGYREASQILRDHRRFGSARLPSSCSLQARGMGEVGTIARLVCAQMLFLDPPAHTAIRTHLAPALSAAAVAGAERQTRTIVRELLDRLPVTGEAVDIVGTFTGPLPTRLMANWLGLPDRYPQLLAWADAYETLLGSLTTLPDVRDAAVREPLLQAYQVLREQARARRGGDGQDLISVLANGLADSTLTGAGLDEALDTVAANCLVLLGGGYQTLTQLVTMAVVRLGQHPDQLAALRADPRLVDAVLDEVMRLDGSSQYLARTARAPAEIAGADIRTGQSVVVLLGAANRDPQQFPDPGTFNLFRPQPGRHLGFGLGRHHCPGALAALHSARIALLQFIGRYPTFALAQRPGAIGWGSHPNTRCPATALIDLHPHPRATAAGSTAAVTNATASTSTSHGPVAVLPNPVGIAVNPPGEGTGTRSTVRPAGEFTAEAFTADALRQLRARNNAPVELTGEQLWMDAVRRIAQHAPHAAALQSGCSVMSYAELDRAADALAVRLRRAGVEPGVVVAIVMDRTADAYVAALAVSRAGGAFLCADTSCPVDRLRSMLGTANAAWVCTQPHLAAWASTLIPDGTAILPVDASRYAEQSASRPPTSGVKPGDTAYIVFTSGSTGTPKAIAIDHEALINLQVAQRQVYRLTPEDRVLQWFSPNFDGWHFDLILGLTAGARLVLAPPAAACVGPALHRALHQYRISAATLTPSAWQTITVEDLSDLRIAATAGEVCTAATVHRLSGAGRRVLNLYGPAEAAIWSTWHQCQPDHGDPPIGSPIVNRRCYLLDADGQPAAAGTTAQLWLGGLGIGRYLRQPDLMEQRFRPDPLATHPGQLMYATGDLCRWQPDGTIHYLGRTDRQVKIHGQRIEPEEIERALTSFPGLTHARVEMEHDTLVATIVVEDPETFSEQTLRAHLNRRLHGAMVPTTIHVTGQAGLTVTGKLHLPATPAATTTTATTATASTLTASTQPDTPHRHRPLASTIAALFAEIAHVPESSVSVDTDFFTIGGDSLSLAELHSKLENAFQVQLGTDELIAGPTPGAIARLIHPATPASTHA